MCIRDSRYQQAPNTVKAYLRRLAGQQVPDGRGDASEVLLADISRWDLYDASAVSTTETVSYTHLDVYKRQPVVIAINMMDVVKKNGDKINVDELSRELGCKIVEISALKGTGIMAAAEAAIEAAKSTKTVPMHTFSGTVEHAKMCIRDRN